jgi:hypothetical protein
MGEIRVFQESDIPEVAALDLTVFRKRAGRAGRDLEDYFRQILLENPWRDEEIRSLVYLHDGRIVAFVGVFPRKMAFRKRVIRVAVITQLMADPKAYRGFAGIELLRRVFQGPQDLTITDGATEPGCTAWRAAGGSVSQLYSLQWRRVLRPAMYLRSLLQERKQNPTFRAVAKVLTPAFRFGDLLAAKLPFRALSPPRTDFCNDLVGPDDLLQAIHEVGWKDTLGPVYEPIPFRWLMSEVSAARIHGNLRMAVVRDLHGKTVGWYVYFARDGQDSAVLQIGAKARHFDQVFLALVHEARQQGATAISGQAIPRYLYSLSLQHCTLRYDGSGFLVYTRDEQLLKCILEGDAAFSRLDGEWWMRFTVENWS